MYYEGARALRDLNESSGLEGAIAETLNFARLQKITPLRSESFIYAICRANLERDDRLET